MIVAAQPLLSQSVLSDAETEKFLSDISEGLAKSAGLQPGALHLYLIGDNGINAFVAEGQVIYMNSGTIESAANYNELQGVIAHELGHIEGGDAIRTDAGAAGAMRISLLSLLLGAAAVAAGAPEAGMAAMMAGQSAAEGKFSTSLEAGPRLRSDRTEGGSLPLKATLVDLAPRPGAKPPP